MKSQREVLMPCPKIFKKHPQGRCCAGDVVAMSLNECGEMLAGLSNQDFAKLCNTIGDYAEAALQQWSPEYKRLHRPRKKKSKQ